MKILKRRFTPPQRRKHSPIPRAVRYVNTLIAIVLFGLSAYHLTQPNEAWRSGLTEIVSAILLLIAAYRVSHVKTLAINLIVACLAIALGIRHLIYGGGWRSGITELFFSTLLITTVYIIFRDRKK